MTAARTDSGQFSYLEIEMITKETVAARIAEMQRTDLLLETLKSLADLKGRQHVKTLAEIGMHLIGAAKSDAAAELDGGHVEDADVLINVANEEAGAVLAGIEALSPGWISFILGGEHGEQSAADLARDAARLLNVSKLPTRIPLATPSGVNPRPQQD